MGLMDGKICIVTGGAGSLGLASAKLLHKEGAAVMLVDLDDTSLKKAAAEIGGDRVAYIAGDVSQAAQVQKYIDATLAKWQRIDVIFSNAGNHGAHKPIAEFPEDNFDAVWAVHVKGAFLAAKYGLPKMSDGGSFIITSSVVGVRGMPGGYAYITAKHAQVGLMRCLAKEVGRRGIRVNTLHPGPIDNQFQLDVENDLSKVIGRNATQMLNELVPLGRHVDAAEVARSVLYLASDLSIYTNGTTLMVDGGMTA
ncbi:MAG TPA: SDR family oxidoreductase [Stellaceae bacterium]|jgi:NAD(P)-dependent dehydrogenase (short-subunit alcohol dehydrogenase family)